MTSKHTSPKRPTSQDILAMLAGVYHNHGIQRDAFGRRAALPSEVASLLAQRTALGGLVMWVALHWAAASIAP